MINIKSHRAKVFQNFTINRLQKKLLNRTKFYFVTPIPCLATLYYKGYIFLFFLSTPVYLRDKKKLNSLYIVLGLVNFPVSITFFPELFNCAFFLIELFFMKHLMGSTLEISTNQIILCDSKGLIKVASWPIGVSVRVKYNRNSVF